ncbi:uncharacterized protein LOC131019932 isoform X2 [Salvia miltiorrhiza]|uniref:uncharacterized protein LOC131019932 isoform X2 n=1 Tax=Salvia miltiorrhiza TaxID=226208 RepID=UPI0025AD524E|nr:uncharacterized protein LOC131019932 isoform X2 [Salvia miltiorrhiza]
MIDGDGIEEKQSPAFATQGDRESDGGDDLSHYSSCGGESEFERYCSASSAMGTPSFRGSSLYDSDFGSLKSFKLGGEISDFNKILGAERVLSGYRESECGSGGNESCRDQKDNGALSLNGGFEGFFVGGVDLRGNFDADGDWGNGVVTESEMKGIADGNVRIAREFVETGKERRFRGSVEKASDSGERLEIDGGEDKNLSDEGEASSRCEHSEGEDSMFGCGSDDERKIDLYYGKNAPFHVEESGLKENRLIMNSAVAFGSDDWDDFVHESSENTIDSMVWGEFQAESKTVGPSGSPATCSQVESGDRSSEVKVNAQSTVSANLMKLDARCEDAKQVLASRNQVSDIDELDEYLGSVASVNDIFQTKKDPLEKAPANEEFITESEMENRNVPTSEAISMHHDIASKRRNLEDENIEVDPVSDSVSNQNDLVAAKGKEEKETRLSEDSSSFAFPLVADTRGSAAAKNNLSSAFDPIEDHFVPAKTRDFELNEFYDEFVNDMEDILLDSAESPVSRLAYSTRINQPQFRRPSRDGGSSASTSGADYANNWIHQPLKIDRVEVVGARQRKGDVSFSERLVGVQKYTVYNMKVWSGEDQWEVERRYRDFYTLYHRLKKLFADNGWTLPPCWSPVERESRKLFGNASPDVIAERSVLIQECLQSIIHHRFPSSSLNALTSFLSPTETVPSSPVSDAGLSQSPLANRGTQANDFSTLGKTISLVVQIRPLKSMKRMLDEQHYRCAGCHRNFDDGRTRMQELVQALGWGKPRLCEYSGQLFCSSCHANDTAVLPARVLHHWDFTRYPVSQLAKSFLDSIHDQPMLCASAVNPFLFSKVPTLQHVANVRNRIRAVLPYVRCQYRRSIYKGLGSRRYLLDSNDFFALKDLIDLSKGVFSALPVMVETVSRKIQEHITDQCLICYDVGVPCGARQDCQDPVALIFPFQAREVEKCRTCDLVFHKNCFKKLASCPCGARFKKEEMKISSNEIIHSVDSSLISPARVVEPSSGILAGLFSKVMPARSQIPRKREAEGISNVIPMGSLPSTSL